MFNFLSPKIEHPGVSAIKRLWGGTRIGETSFFATSPWKVQETNQSTQRARGVNIKIHT